MDKKIVLSVFALVIVSITVLLMLPESAKDSPDMLPWRIQHPTPDTSQIFGVTLGQSTLGDTERVFKELSEVSLFKTSDGKMLVEAFFDELNFNGLKAKFVLTVGVPESELLGMFKRGLRMNSTPSGKRITLTPDDVAHIRNTPITSFTYLPTVKLDEAILAKRFGVPNQRVQEKNGGALHWLYPQQGLDVVLGGSEKPLLQYVAPKDFERLRAPLLANGEVLP
jgi:hypothetical protein